LTKEQTVANVLVAYATVEGQTRKIAQFLADGLARRRHDAKLRDLTAEGGDVDLAGFDAVILAASVHVGRHHVAAVQFAADHADALSRKPSAFVSVSIHAMSSDPDDEEEARAYVDAFCAETGWLPRAVSYAAGALRFTKYDFFKRMVARSLAKERGITPGKDGDMEFTDWPALRSFLDGFLRDQVLGG
jgi:menaquinone-dependent protoporphyrinogen oxidase